MICFHQLKNSYEPNFGGFSDAPKFPQPVNFNLLFYMYARDPSTDLARECLEMCVHTLKKMALGGIHDHIGQVSLLRSRLLLRVSALSVFSPLS